jgi:hypothetical protein
MWNVETDKTAAVVRFTVQVDVPFHQAEAFAEALSGHDDDVILAAETAMRERLGRTDGAEIEIYTPPSRFNLTDELRTAASLVI